MKVLLLGATGNLGSRLVPALLTHGHQVVTYVRSPKKLASIFPPSVYAQLITVQGDATDSAAIKQAILQHNCDAVVNTAGVAAMAPWGHSDLPKIFKAVFEAVRDAVEKNKRSLRVWFLGGLGLLHYPGTETWLSSYIPVFLEHRQNLRLLQSLSTDKVVWSVLCPAFMAPESSEFTVPTKSSEGELVASAMTPPLWQDSWLSYVPLLGRYMSAGMNASRYNITLEQAADFIASDLKRGDNQWKQKTVGVIKRPT